MQGIASHIYKAQVSVPKCTPPLDLYFPFKIKFQSFWRIKTFKCVTKNFLMCKTLLIYRSKFTLVRIFSSQAAAVNSNGIPFCHNLILHVTLKSVDDSKLVSLK